MSSERIYPASCSQEGILFSLEAIGPQALRCAPHFPVAFRFASPPRSHHLIRALEELGRHHEALRTSLERVARYEADERALYLALYRRTGVLIPGLYQQRVHGSASIPLHERDIDSPDEGAGIAALVESEIDEAFAASDPYRPRALLLHSRSGDHWLILVLSHLIVDGWSVRILQRELPALYTMVVHGGTKRLSQVPGSYGQFAVAQQRQLACGDLHDAAAYWINQCSGAADAYIRHDDLPFAQTSLGDRAIRRVSKKFSGGEAAAMLDVARRLRTSPALIGRTALTITLHGCTGKPRIALWASYPNRGCGARNLVGPFANTHLMTVDIRPGDLCTSLLKRMYCALMEGRVHQAFPAAALSRFAGRNVTAQFDTRVNFDVITSPRLPDLSALIPTPVNGGRRWMDLDVRLRRTHDEWSLEATYDTNRYSDDGVVEFLASVHRVVMYWCRHEDATVESCIRARVHQRVC